MIANDRIDTDRARALAGLLDLDGRLVREGDVLRPMWQVAYLLPRPAQADLGPDGHPRTQRGAEVRRMFAGGRLTLRPGLRFGRDVTAHEEVVAEREKLGTAGRMVFVTSRTTVSCDGVVSLVDERDVVYLEGARPRPSTRAGHRDELPMQGPRGGVDLDPTLLFRFSALTYNAHRIHYDARYARETEGYPGLVVHGPLQALLMAEAATTELVGPLGTAISDPVQFDYRLVEPLFLGQGLVVSTTLTSTAEAAVKVSDATGRVTAHGSLRVQNS